MRCHFDSELDDELIDDHLRAVGEVAELRFPDHQLVRIGEAEAELEAEHGVLGEHAVDDEELALAGADVVERHVASRRSRRRAGRRGDG